MEEINNKIDKNTKNVFEIKLNTEVESTKNLLKEALFDIFYETIIDHLIEENDGKYCFEGRVDVSITIPKDTVDELPWNFADRLESLGMERMNGLDGVEIDGQKILIEMTKTCTEDDMLLAEASEFPFVSGVLQDFLFLIKQGYDLDFTYTTQEDIEDNKL